MAPMAMGPRLEMVQQLIAHQVCVPEAARAYGVTAPTVRKWLGRFLAQGQAGLADASSRPTVSPRAIAPAKALAIVELRRKRLTQARIAQALGVSASTVSRVLARAGLSHLADLEPAEPVVRYEHQAPGDLLHIDIKKLGRIQRPGHRVTGNRRDTVEGAGWDFVFVAIDDHARVAFTDIHPDERFPSAVQFLKDAVAYYQRLGVTIQRLLTDNGSAFRSRAFAALCHELGIKHRFTRPYRPQTNGKAERFIQSALREWAYAHTYQNSQHRADAMKSWLHHYNWHRPHQGIGRAVPISRLNLDEYNLLTVHSYAAHLRVGRAKGAARPRLAREHGGTALVDAGSGLAYPACALAAALAIERARQHGVAFVAVANSHHFGAAAYHLEAVAAAGLVGLAFGNSPAAMPAWGGRRALLGTNPVAAAFPRRRAAGDQPGPGRGHARPADDRRARRRVHSGRLGAGCRRPAHHRPARRPGRHHTARRGRQGNHAGADRRTAGVQPLRRAVRLRDRIAVRRRRRAGATGPGLPGHRPGRAGRHRHLPRTRGNPHRGHAPRRWRAPARRAPQRAAQAGAAAWRGHPRHAAGAIARHVRRGLTPTGA
ncbi:transposase, IS481 family [Bordetella pertussis H918]|nr:transposase, IS481 family [Bordetella pertussis H918]